MAGQNDERGRPATFDPHSGAVRGSGSGAGGGGNPNEDLDADPAGGGGADPVTAPPDEQSPNGRGTGRDEPL